VLLPSSVATSPLLVCTALSLFFFYCFVVAAEDASAAAQSLAGVSGVTRVLAASGAQYKGGIAEVVAPLLKEVQAASGATHIVGPATPYAKNILPRLAALLDVNQISDVIEIESEDTFQRPIYAGNAIATVQSADPIKILSVRATNFAPAEEGGSAAVEDAPSVGGSDLSKFVGQELTASDRPELSSASKVKQYFRNLFCNVFFFKVVAGGRALKSTEAFETVLYPLADKLGAGVGASRAAVDAGYVPNDMQVGQTGKIVAPELYIAAGISGAIQVDKKTGRTFVQKVFN
jgi:electron transfer flavoprotein alpha subunit